MTLHSKVVSLLYFGALIIAMSVACGVNVSVAQIPGSQTVFHIDQNPEEDDPAAFLAIDWAQEEKITIKGLRYENYPVFIGELDSGNVFPFYMNNSQVSGTMPVISPDNNYLAFQSDGKAYVALMSTIASDKYAISPESIISVFDFPFRCDLAWSSNSQQLAFVCLAVDDGIGISLVTPTSNERQDVFQYVQKSISEVEGVSWSSDIKALAFSVQYAYDEETKNLSQADVFIFHFDTHALIRVTDTPSNNELDPEWYPGHEILTYTSTATSGGPGLDSRLVFSTEDGKCVKEVPDLRGISSPAWSPDGSQLAYVSEWMKINLTETSKIIPLDFLSTEGLCNTRN